MSVIKLQGVNGSTKAFVPSFTAEPKQETSTAAALPSAEELLLSVSPQARKAMIQELFADELAEMAETAQKNGLEKGCKEADILADEQIQQQLLALERHIEQWTSLIKITKDTTSWQIAEKAQFVTLLFEAACVLLQQQLADKTYIESVVDELVQKYARHAPKTLKISPVHYQQLQAGGKLADLEQHLEIKACAETQVGSFSLQLAQSTVSYQLDVALEAFKAGLVALSAESGSI